MSNVHAVMQESLTQTVVTFHNMYILHLTQLASSLKSTSSGRVSLLTKHQTCNHLTYSLCLLYTSISVNVEIYLCL